MTREEYEIARLATKCAGLQGKIDDQAAEIASLQETLDAVTRVASDAENLVISQMDEIAALKEQVAQQATVIKQMRDALHLAANNMTYVGARNWDVIANALLLQPSPEILQAQDERVAEACAKIVDPRSLNHITRGDALTAIRSGEWRSYL